MGKEQSVQSPGESLTCRHGITTMIKQFSKRCGGVGASGLFTIYRIQTLINKQTYSCKGKCYPWRLEPKIMHWIVKTHINNHGNHCWYM